MQTNTSENAKRPYGWKLFVMLWSLAIGASLLGIPFTQTLRSGSLAGTATAPSISALILTIVLGNGILFGPTIGIGLILSSRLGLGAPLIAGCLEKQPLGSRIPKVVFHSVVSGVVVSIIILFMANYIFGPPWLLRLEAEGITISELQPPSWQGFLVSITAGVREEILFRLFLLTLFAWIGSILRKRPNVLPPNWILWIATLLTAALFGISHLPGTAAIGLSLDTLVITRALVLNGLGGVVFGWLYWTRGLESAILAHFSADVVLHAVVPLIDQLSGM